jgi:hypothetical protein
LSYIDPRLVISYLENIENRASVNMENTRFESLLCRPPGIGFLKQSVRSGEEQPKYKTTITPFGPILPTGFTLPAPDLTTFGERHMSSKVIHPIESLQKIVSAGNTGFGNQSSSVAAPTVGVSKLKASTTEMVRRILANESSSESESDELKQEDTNVFKEQATAIPSRANSPSNPPAPLPKAEERMPLSPPLRVAGVVRTPRSERIQKKRDELEKVQQFLEESRVVHEKIYSGFDVRRVSTRGPAAERTGGKRRSLSDYVSEASNVAELRRNIADKYSGSNNREPSPLPPLAQQKLVMKQQPAAIKTSSTNRTRTASADRENAGSSIVNKGSVRTPSASSRSPKVASPDRLVSGVFVSYPRKKRSESAPPSSEKEQSPVLKNQKKNGAKMTVDEYAELRRNLLSRSEQHAVSNN